MVARGLVSPEDLTLVRVTDDVASATEEISSRITAIQRLEPSLPAYFFGAENRQWEPGIYDVSAEIRYVFVSMYK